MIIRTHTTEELDSGGRALSFFPIQKFETDTELEAFGDQQHDLILKLIKFLERSLAIDEREGGFFVSEDVWPSHGMSAHISAQYITPSLLLSLINFLCEHDPRYTITTSLYNKTPLFGENYVGRVFIHKDVLHVEKSVLKNDRFLKALVEFEAVTKEKNPRRNPPFKIRSYTTEEMERGMRAGMFFLPVKLQTQAETDAFYDQQGLLIVKLVKLMERTLETKSHEGFFVNGNQWLSRGLRLNLWAEHLSTPLLSTLINFLRANDPSYMILISLFEELCVNANYLGRIFINTSGLHVEKIVMKNEGVKKDLVEFQSLMVKKKKV